MAIADVTPYASLEASAIELLATRTTTNSPPSGAAAGLACYEISNLYHGRMPSDVTLLVYSTAGSGTMTVTCRLWGYTPVNSGMWMPLGPGADATKGIIDLGSAIGETGADVIRHSETISLPGHFERLYLEITAIGGTATSVGASLVARRAYP